MINTLDSLAGLMKMDTTICALATPPGTGAIAVIRVSGKNTFSILEKIFIPTGKRLRVSDMSSHTVHLGRIVDGDEMIDEVLLTIFRAPKSYTGQDVAEISCHGSRYIQSSILTLLMKNGAIMAKPGEFTLRAYLNGKLDLSQAEAVADLINAEARSAHQLALKQMRGGFSSEIQTMRQSLIDFVSLIELELDFPEEDVEFADRSQLINLLASLREGLHKLLDSFKMGNVIKNGVPVAIIGKPNVGKSTLLNALLNDERAIVSDIPGTTRDTVEDTIVLDGITFRFIDTAGLRQSDDVIETLGIARTYEKINQARIILYVFDVNDTTIEEIEANLEDFRHHIQDPDKKFILVANKTDLLVEAPRHFANFVELDTVFISAKRKENTTLLTDLLVKSVRDFVNAEGTVISNIRHYEAISKADAALAKVEHDIAAGLSPDLLSSDIRTALHYLGEITGTTITSEDILGNIFSKFCIGK
ncbi:MAG: tRNA uridine-5-carboxymethylaminomethyl(34) synthesis GTPase MnmE [Bacteroidales bacterium]|jgi:tRNA modification GTPase